LSYNLLIVDHDSIIREQVSSYLGSKFTIVEADSAEKGLLLFNSQRVDLILTDLALPMKSGLDLLREVRSQSNIPVVFLSLRDAVEDQVQAYENGADDYIVKPYDFKLLLLKLSSLLQRCYPDGIAESHVLNYGELEVNKQSRIVKLAGTEVPFRPKEFDLLALFMENPGAVLDRDRILDAIWGVDYFGDSRVVDTHVKKVRKKIGPYNQQILTVFGVGYKFEK